MATGSHDEQSEQSWFEYRRLVLGELERINTQIITLGARIEGMDGVRSKDISDLRVKVGMLEVRASLFGAGAGLAITIGAQLFLKFAH